MCHGGRVSLAVLNLCGQITAVVATFDADRSVTDSTQSVSQSLFQSRSFLILHSSRSAQLATDRRCVRRNDQVSDRLEVSLLLCTYNVHTR